MPLVTCSHDHLIITSDLNLAQILSSRIFLWLDKNSSLAYLGGLMLVLGVSCPDVCLFGWLGGLPGLIGWPSHRSLPFWLLRGFFPWSSWFLECVFVCALDCNLGGFLWTRMSRGAPPASRINRISVRITESCWLLVWRLPVLLQRHSILG